MVLVCVEKLEKSKKVRQRKDFRILFSVSFQVGRRKENFFDLWKKVFAREVCGNS